MLWKTSISNRPAVAAAGVPAKYAGDLVRSRHSDTTAPSVLFNLEGTLLVPPPSHDNSRPQLCCGFAEVRLRGCMAQRCSVGALPLA